MVPFWSLFRTSLSTSGGSIYLPTLTFDWDFGNYVDAFSHVPGPDPAVVGLRVHGHRVCRCCSHIPLAYVIAFKSGRYKNLLLGSGDPAVLRDVPDPHAGVEDDPGRRRVRGAARWAPSGLLPSDGRLLSTSWAVIGGLIYNSMIFMILPLYVSLEKIDPRLLEASKDLYSSNSRAVPPR